MKKIFLISAIIAIPLLLIIGCKKGDINGDFAAVGKGSYLTKVAIGNAIIDYANLANSKVDVTVKEYGSPVDKIKIWVSAGLTTLDKAGSWKAIKEVPYSGETKLEVSATEIATALGIPVTDLSPGTSYTLYNEVFSKDGQTHDITNTGSDFYGNPNYNMLMLWTATSVCPFTGGMAGNYRVVRDDWVDWSPGDIVAVTDGPGANQVNLTQVWPNPAYGSPVDPFVVNVAAATGVATITSGVTIGDYGSFTLVTGSGSSGYIFSCTGDIILKVRLSAPPF
ncbi:MAG: hypothetical protein EPN92_11730, partial [Chitinophagaceae bacterium]